MITLQGSDGGMVSAGSAERGVAYPGLVTRGIAFALDAVAINLVATVVGIGASLILSLLHLPSDVKTILAAVGSCVYVLWLIGYFVVFWSTTGQTPGGRVMQLKVQGWDGGLISAHRALIRCGGLFLAALPLFLGFVPILYDDRRRGLQDRIAGTVVVDAPAVSMVDARRARKRAEYLGLREHEAEIPRRTEGTIGTETRGAQPSSEPRISSPEFLQPLGHDDPRTGFEQREV